MAYDIAKRLRIEMFELLLAYTKKSAGVLNNRAENRIGNTALNLPARL